MLLNIKNQHFAVAFFVVALTLFSLVVSPGYTSFVDDQPAFLPPLYSKLDPTLFPNDVHWFKVMFTERTLLTDFLAFFVRGGINIFWLLFFLTVISRAMFFASLYYIVRFLTNNPLYALLALLFFVTPFFIPGMGLATIESAFSYRVLALAASLFFLALYLHGKCFVSFFPLIFGFVIHPITAAPFLMFFYIHTGWKMFCERANRSSVVKNALIAFIPAVFIFFFLIYKTSGIGGSFFVVMDNEWKMLARGRNDPFFFAFWDTQWFASLISWILLGVIPLMFIKQFIHDKDKRTVITILFIIPFVLLAIAGIGEYLLLHGIVQLNLQRGLLLLNILIPILIGAFALWHIEKNKNLILKNGLLFSILLWFLVKEDFVFMREQMLFFLPPLTIIFYSGEIAYFKRYKKLSVFTALIALGLGLVVATKQATKYHDLWSLGVFYLLLLGGFTVAFLHKYKKTYTRSDLLIKSATIAAIFPLIISSLLNIKNFTIYPYFLYDNSYREACDWVEQNTSKDDVFIVEPFAFKKDPREFRLACLRSIFTALRDTALPYEPRALTFEWKHRQDLERALLKDWNTLEQIHNKYRVDYIFSEEKLPIEKEVVFQNDKIFIYSL